MKRNNKKLDPKDPRYMTKEQEQIVNLILSNNELKSGKDVSNIFNELRGKVIQRLLDAEMEAFLGYDKSEHGEKESSNRRNGYTSKAKKVKTDTGEITICPPRDRDGKFEPQIVKKRQRVLEGFDEIAIAMYAKGMSLKDISEMIQHIYKVELSIETISKLTSSVSEEVKKWQERPLEKFYPFIYVDCLYAPVKRDLISEKVAIYVMLGINKDGKKDVLGIWINENESATFWTEVFEEIKARGVEEILFISLDGLSGLSEAIEKIYPKVKTQRCIVHIVRNIYGILDKKKSKEIIGDLKKIYTASNGNNAKLEYENFIEKYKSNEKLIKKLNSVIEHIFNIFEYPVEIRKIIYTTNPIESLNSSLRKVTRGKGSFISKEALLKVLYLRIKDLEKSWSKGTKNWDNVLKDEYNKDYFKRLRSFLKKEYSTKICYPKKEEIFNALKYTNYEDVKVVILGQDPYHGENEAHGFCFSVRNAVRRPPSLNNILKELYDDLKIVRKENELTSWAEQGVLLLNSVLTVVKDTPLSHRGIGWEEFTDSIIKKINEKDSTVVYILWGSYARSKKYLITNPKHYVIESAHPSPLSANKGFFGSKPFSKTNEILIKNNIKPINW